MMSPHPRLSFKAEIRLQPSSGRASAKAWNTRLDVPDASTPPSWCSGIVITRAERSPLWGRKRPLPPVSAGSAKCLVMAAGLTMSSVA